VLVKYESQLELSYILSELERFKSKELIRNSKAFKYQIDNKTHKYYPDFYCNTTKTYIEIKHLTDYQQHKSIIDLKMKAVDKIALITNNIIDYKFTNEAKNLIHEYERNN